MGLHDLDSAGLLRCDFLCVVDGAEVAVPYRILYLIFFHSIDSLYNIRKRES